MHTVNCIYIYTVKTKIFLYGSENFHLNIDVAKTNESHFSTRGVQYYIIYSIGSAGKFVSKLK